MPQQGRRRAARDRYSPEYSDDGYDSYPEDDYDDYASERRARPRRKSATRDMIDRVSRSISRLGISNNRSPSRTRTRRARVYSPSPSPSPRPAPRSSRRPGYGPRHRSADSYYPPSSSAYAARRPRNRRRGSSYSASPPPSRRRGGGAARRDGSNDNRLRQAAWSALDAAVVEGLRVRQEPGSWSGGKGRRVATAALGAAAVGAVAAGKGPEKHSKLKTIESTIGGLLANRVLNGPRRDLEREARSRSRSRSRW